MTEPQTIARLLAAGADDSTAIAAPGRAPLTNKDLRRLAGEVRAALNAHGIGRGDRVAIVLANGPEMAAAFLTVACAATTAPLNPAYRDEELDFYLSDLGARALMVEAGADTPARAVAARLGVPICELTADARAAGLFTLAGPAQPRAIEAGAAEADDVALVLHTSGTTSRPKIVPLSHANLCASARHIGATLKLGAGDLCLNVMPLFHIHGLVAGVLSSLAAGAAVACTPGFNALRFY
ncbi:MAG TPA: AMP-binding protein, partial [Alphaproteobacteria bacterium]